MADGELAFSLAALVRPVCLNTLRIPRGLRIGVLGPHPDDFDAIGATLRLLQRNGNPLSAAVLTGAASGVEDAFCQPPTVAEKARIRELEQRASFAFFGLPEANFAFLRLEEGPDGHLLANAANFARVRDWLDRTAPDWVFLPHGNDSNLDHQRTFAFFRELAARPGAKPLTALLIRDPKTAGMRVDAYTAFDAADAAWKAELLRCHRSQHQRNLNTRGHGFDERILKVNAAIAAELTLAVPYAEAFELITPAPTPA